MNNKMDNNGRSVTCAFGHISGTMLGTLTYNVSYERKFVFYSMKWMTLILASPLENSPFEMYIFIFCFEHGYLICYLGYPSVIQMFVTFFLVGR